MARPALRVMLLDPAHFHASLLLQRPRDVVHPRLTIYAPFSRDVMTMLEHTLAFNQRAVQPTEWEPELRCGPDFYERYLRELPGTVVILAGRNRPKIDRMLASVQSAIHVLADKPWIIRLDDLPKVEEMLHQATLRELQVQDVMTERYTIPNILQRELICDRDLFGTLIPGTLTEPGISLASMHSLAKVIAGRPIRRPIDFFNPIEHGEPLADIGTHLVDLAMWIGFPEQAMDYRKDVQLHCAEHEQLSLSLEQFGSLTGERAWPVTLKEYVRDNRLQFTHRNRVRFGLKNIHVSVNVGWDYQLPGDDLHMSEFRGSRCSLAIQQDPNLSLQPELFITPNHPDDHPAIQQLLVEKLNDWDNRFPGVSVRAIGPAFQVVIPPELRLRHEAQFAYIFTQFLHLVVTRRACAPWERSNLLTKYYITTKGVAMANEK